MNLRSPAMLGGRVLAAGLAVAVGALELSNLFVFAARSQHEVLTVCLLLLSALPLAGWHRWPFLVLQVTGWSTVALAGLHSPHLGLGPIAATYAVACWGATGSRRAAAALLLVAVWLVPVLTGDASAIPTNAALFAAAWILGALTRDRRNKTAVLQAQTVELAHEREEKALLAAEMERARIARELHDVLAHSVSVMVIQAQAAQASGADHERITAALRRIEAIGQDTLTQLRGLLRRVAASDTSPAREPQPGLDQLDELLDEVRAAGLAVSLRREGTVRAVPASVELSAYRIVQEALTNTMRHSAATSASVLVRYMPDELAVEVLDHGPRAPNASNGHGRGLAGMRERADLTGGSLVAEPRLDGGFRVGARLPLRATP
ncbi:MAG: sensor histidine kinase [Solirubrobacteraceae bacterium]